MGDEVAWLVAERNKTKLQKIANVYMLHQKRIGSAVKSKVDLVEFVATNDRIEKNLVLMQIDREDFDLCFADEDGNELFVRWGIFIQERDPPQPLVFETVGEGAMRKIAWSNGNVTEVDDAEYEELKRGQIDKDSGFKGPEEFEREMEKD